MGGRSQGGLGRRRGKEKWVVGAKVDWGGGGVRRSGW